MLTFCLAIFLLLLTLLPIVRNRHWLFRTPMYLSIQVGIFTLIVFIFNLIFRLEYFWFTTAICCIILIIQIQRILGFAIDFKRHVKQVNETTDHSFTILIFNVYQYNEKYEEVAKMLEEKDADVVLLVEVDQKWQDALEHLPYPHIVDVAKDNTYGMLLLSKFPYSDFEIRYIVEKDVPSVMAKIDINGSLIRIYGIHPKPPVPGENESSYPKDLEVTLLAREISKEPHPHTIVAGDLNDVPWSQNSKFFIKHSELKDPRIGRGLFGTFPSYFPIKIPLDHVFCSSDFGVIDIQKLPSSGSDHHPLLIRFAIL